MTSVQDLTPHRKLTVVENVIQLLSACRLACVTTADATRTVSALALHLPVQHTPALTVYLQTP